MKLGKHGMDQMVRSQQPGQGVPAALARSDIMAQLRKSDYAAVQRPREGSGHEPIPLRYGETQGTQLPAMLLVAA